MPSDPRPARDLDQPASREWSAEQGTALGVRITLARCYATYSGAVAAKVREYGSTAPQFVALEALYHLGPLSLSALADELLVTGGNVTYIMDRLEDQDLARRYRSSDDRRVVHATLTPAGRALVAEILPGHIGQIERLSSQLTEEEQETLRRLLQRLGKGIADSDL